MTERGLDGLADLQKVAVWVAKKAADLAIPVDSLGPLRFGRWYQFIVHVERIDALIEKAQGLSDQ